MADAKIAGASVVISANADKLAAGLADAKKKTEKFAKDQNGLWGKIGDKFGGGGGGFLAKSLGAGFFGGIAGALAIRAMNFIANGISDVISGTAKWTQELGRANLHATLLAASMERATKVRDEWTETTSGGVLKDRLKRDESIALSGRSSAEGTVEHIRKRLETLNSFGFTNTMASFAGHRDRDKAILEAELSRSEAEAGKFAARLDEIREKLLRLDPTKDPAVKAGLDKYIADLTLKTDALGTSVEEVAHKAMMAKGDPKTLALADEKFKRHTERTAVMTAREYADELERAAKALTEGAGAAERMKVAEFAAKDAGVAHAVEVVRMRDALKAADRARADEPAKELLKTLQMQRATLGMTANEAKLLELRLGGAARGLIAAGAVEAGFLDHMDAKGKDKFEPKFAGAVLADSADAFSMEMKHKFGRHGDRDKGMGMWDVVMALGRAAKTLESIDKKVGKAGGF